MDEHIRGSLEGLDSLDIPRVLIYSTPQHIRFVGQGTIWALTSTPNPRDTQIERQTFAVSQSLNAGELVEADDDITPPEANMGEWHDIKLDPIDGCLRTIQAVTSVNPRTHHIYISEDGSVLAANAHWFYQWEKPIGGFPFDTKVHRKCFGAAHLADDGWGVSEHGWVRFGNYVLKGPESDTWTDFETIVPNRPPKALMDMSPDHIEQGGDTLDITLTFDGQVVAEAMIQRKYIAEAIDILDDEDVTFKYYGDRTPVLLETQHESIGIMPVVDP